MAGRPPKGGDALSRGAVAWERSLGAAGNRSAGLAVAVLYSSSVDLGQQASCSRGAWSVEESPSYAGQTQQGRKTWCEAWRGFGGVLGVLFNSQDLSLLQNVPPPSLPSPLLPIPWLIPWCCPGAAEQAALLGSLGRDGPSMALRCPYTPPAPRSCFPCAGQHWGLSFNQSLVKLKS